MLRLPYPLWTFFRLTTSSPERGAGRNSNATVWRRFGGSTRSILQSRVKKLDKIERVAPPKRRQTVAFEFLPAPRCMRSARLEALDELDFLGQHRLLALELGL